MRSVLDLNDSERTMVLVDGPSVHMTSKVLKFGLDYKKIRDHVKDYSELHHAVFFTVIDEQNDGVPADAIFKNIDYLENNDWRVETRTAFTFTDGTTGLRKTGGINLGVRITNAMRDFDLSNIDHIVLFSGNGDLVDTVERCQSLGAKVTVVGHRDEMGTGFGTMAADLIRAADKFVEISDTDVRAEFERVYPVR